jgi:5-methylcytosine-specific restriction endonuclease McrA
MIRHCKRRSSFRRYTPTEKEIKDFYTSKEWAVLRYDTLERFNRRCLVCGATPDDGKRIVADHIRPVRYYWHLRLDPNNIQCLCCTCNRGKGNRVRDWRPKFIESSSQFLTGL